MRVPKRVKIISNTLSDDEYYEQFVGQEFDVVAYNDKYEEVTLPIKSSHKEDINTEWQMCEVEVLEWSDEYDKNPK